MKIMELSSKLEAQCVSDSLTFKTERERWALEKKSFIKQIEDLEDEKQKLLHSIHRAKTHEASTHPTATTDTAENIDVQNSQHMIREEVRCLRTKCNDLESALQGLQQESMDFGQAFAKLGAAGQRLERHFQTLPQNIAPQENADNPIVRVEYWGTSADG